MLTFFLRPKIPQGKRRLLKLCCVLAAAVAGIAGVPGASGTASAAGVPAVLESKAQPAADTVSAPSVNFPFPADKMPLRLGIVKYVKPSPYEPILAATIRALEHAFGKNNIVSTVYTLSELSQAIRSGEVDLFLSSSGFYVRMERFGARAVATAASSFYPDPNHNDGSAILVAAERSDLKKLSDLRGKRLVTSTRTAFTGRQLVQHVILEEGYNPETFFAEERYLGDGDKMAGAIPLLLSGEADAGIFRLCFLEDWIENHPEHADKLRVINRLDSPESPEPCMRSTPLYPSWTVATTPATAPEVSRLIMQALFEMRPTPGQSLYWSAATDYASVDGVFRDLMIGPYAYLREWTTSRIISEYGEWLIIFLLFVIGLIFHSVRITKLVRVRTEHLERALREQKRLQREAQASSERIERMSRIGAVGQLCTIFAHEMRQPLATMSLYLYGLRKLIKSGKLTGDKAEAILEKLEAQSARADAIVSRVRAYAKSETPERVPVSLPEAVRKAVAELTTAGRWHARINVTAPREVKCLADPLELELVAMNLVKNALEAVEAFPAGLVNITVLDHEGVAELTVINNGPEVSPDLIDRLEESLPSSKKNGLGLGLSIVRGILERLGGRLTFAALEGGGLAAVAVLPTLEKTLAAAASGTSSEAEASGQKKAESGQDKQNEQEGTEHETK